MNSTDHHDFFNILFVHKLKSGAGLTDSYPFVRDIFSKNCLIGIVFNRQYKKFAFILQAMIDKSLRESSSAGDNSEFFLFNFHVLTSSNC